MRGLVLSAGVLMLMVLPRAASTQGIEDPCEDAQPVVTGCAVDAETGACACDEAALLDIACLCPEGAVDHVVCIDDFQYAPINLSVASGETVAWVNVEGGCNGPPAGLFGENCDAGHTVSTNPLPDAPDLNEESFHSGFLCSPNAAADNAGACTNPRNQGTNVFCRTYGEASTLHYSCRTNPVHTILMHGAVETE